MVSVLNKEFKPWFEFFVKEWRVFMNNNNKNNLPYNSDKQILNHNERSLFGNYSSSGKFGTNGYYSNPDGEIILEGTLENKLHQSRNETKSYYSILKNELMSFGASPKMGEEYEIFVLFEKSVAKLAVYCGRVRLTLGFNKKRVIRALKKEVDQLEDILVSNGYIDMYVSDDEQCKRALDLINVLMRDLHVVRDSYYKPVDFVGLYPIIENAQFTFVEEEDQFIPEMVVVGDGVRKSRAIWILIPILLVMFIALIAIGSCAIIRSGSSDDTVPTFTILDKDDQTIIDDQTEFDTELDIFSNPLYGGLKIIYPGRSDAYQFYINNNNSFDFDCALKIVDENNWNINMKFKLRVANVNVMGAASDWMSLTELNEYIDLHNIRVPANSKLYCVLDWKWVDAENDTQIGQDGLATYTLKFIFDDFKKVESNK